MLNQVFVTILQKETLEHEGQMHTIRCGSTLVIDLDEARVTYVIGKGLHDSERLQRTIAFKEGRAGGAPWPPRTSAKATSRSPRFTISGA